MRRLRCACGLVLAWCTVASSGWAQGSGAVPSGASGAAVKPAEPEPEPGKKKPNITPPKLIRFADAPYPPEAAKANLQGDVLLKLTIDAQGRVTNAEVKEPLGHGFDEAAQAAALKFEYEPALRDGKPVTTFILFRYSFTLKEVPPPVDAPPPLPPNSGELAATLKIAGSDVPLAGVEVVITLPDGGESRATTDEQGRFALKPTPAGRYKLKIRAPGFLEFNGNEEVAAGEATDLVYRINPQPTGIEILVEGERPAREVTRRTVERREIERIPGTSGDALRSIQSLPGVARPPGLAGLLIVRGSSPQDTNIFADGTLLPLVYHFGGLSSVVPTELLERIDFYPGNFSAKYGRVQGGIVDVGLRSPDTQCFKDYGKASNRNGCYHGLLQVDLIDARTLVQGPILGSKEWSFALAGRRSWLDSWLKPVLESAGTSVTTAPVYYDYQAIVERRHKKSRLSLRAYGSDDKLKLILNDPAAADPAFGGGLSASTSFWRLQALYRDELTPRVSVDTMLSWGSNVVDFSIGNFLFRLETKPFYARHEFGFRLAEGVKLNAGLDFLVSPYEVQVRAPDPPRPGEPDPGPYAARPPRESHEKGTAFRPAWYAEFELAPTSRLRVVPGIRFDYARDSGHVDFSPRLNARFDLVTAPNAEEQALGVTRRRTTLKGGIGVFKKPPEFQETNPVFGTPNLYSNRSIHYSFGVEQVLTTQVEASVEAFYKDLTSQVSRSAIGTSYAYDNRGTGSVIGLETLIKYKPDDRFFGWLAYTLSRSVRRDQPDSQKYLFQYDQTHILILLGSYRLGRGWEFGARFRLISGNLTTPVVSPPAVTAFYAADAGSYAAIQGKAYSRRMPLFHQLDVRIDKRWQFKDWRFSTYLDIQNAYNNAAVEDISYNFDFTKQQYQTGIPIIPSLGMRGEF